MFPFLATEMDECADGLAGLTKLPAALHHPRRAETDDVEANQRHERHQRDVDDVRVKVLLVHLSSRARYDS